MKKNYTLWRASFPQPITQYGLGNLTRDHPPMRLEKTETHCRMQVLWHPHEASKVATAGWDGVVKFWD